MKITRAIPERLRKSHLNEQEREELKQFEERAMTVEEIEAHERDQAEFALQMQRDKIKAQRDGILQHLNAIDIKSIRAIREGNQARITELEIEAAGLREELKSLIIP